MGMGRQDKKGSRPGTGNYQGAPNSFPISKYFVGTEFSCKCCGYLRLERELLEALDKMSDHYGKPGIIQGCMCYDEAQKEYRRKHPSALRRRGRAIPMHHGRGCIVSWPFTKELAIEALKHRVVAFEDNGNTALSMFDAI